MTSSSGPLKTPGAEPRTTMRVAVIVAAALVGGAALLAITRADSLLLDLAALGICF